MYFMRAKVSGGRASGPLGSPITFTASTPGVKRDRKDLNPSDFYLENYRKNPVVLYAHDYGGSHLPIGRADVSMGRDRLVAKVLFDQEDDFARQIERKYRSGFMHAVSIGWDDVEIDGRLRYDLLDISAVPVPGDPDAVIVARGLARSYRRWFAGLTERQKLEALDRRLKAIQERAVGESIKRYILHLLRSGALDAVLYHFPQERPVMRVDDWDGVPGPVTVLRPEIRS